MSVGCSTLAGEFESYQSCMGSQKKRWDQIPVNCVRCSIEGRRKYSALESIRGSQPRPSLPNLAGKLMFEETLRLRGFCV